MERAEAGFSALGRAVGFEAPPSSVSATAAHHVSVLSVEPWGLKLIANPPRARRVDGFSALGRAVGFEAGGQTLSPGDLLMFQCSRSSRGV